MTSASLMISSGMMVASRSETAYHARPSGPHFARLRSMPSTFRTTGIPMSRGSTANTALAALTIRTASNLRGSASTVEMPAWEMVSKYLPGIIGTKRCRTPAGGWPSATRPRRQ